MLEASELAEFTQWARDAEIAEITRQRHGEITQEMADIAILLSYMAHDLSIDLEKAVADKLETNGRRYPVDKARGTAKKCDQLD